MINEEIRGKIRRLYYVKHFTMHAISDVLGIHHGTVRRALNSEKFNPKIAMPDPLLPFHNKICETLDLYPKITGKRIFKMLKEQGYQGNLKRVRKYLTVTKPRIKARIFQKVEVIAGEQAQMDWAHFGKLKCGDIERPLYAFVMTLSWSRAIFVRFSFESNVEALLRHHHRAFSFFEGVPRCVVYDNMKTAVIDRIGTKVRLHPSLEEFSGKYGFEPSVCAPYNPNSKGRVERAIRFLRENFFVGLKFDRLDDLNDKAHQWCLNESLDRMWQENKKQTVHDALQQERKTLLPLPHAIHLVPKVKSGISVDKYGYVKFDLNFYAVPQETSAPPISLMADDEKVRIYSGCHMVVEHERCWEKEQRIGAKYHTAYFEKINKKKEVAYGFKLIRAKLDEIAEFNTLLNRSIDQGQDSRSLLKFLQEALDLYGSESIRSLVLAADNEKVAIVSDLQRILGTQMQSETPSITLQLPERPDVRDLYIKSHDLNLYDDL